MIDRGGGAAGGGRGAEIARPIQGGRRSSTHGQSDEEEVANGPFGPASHRNADGTFPPAFRLQPVHLMLAARNQQRKVVGIVELGKSLPVPNREAVITASTFGSEVSREIVECRELV